MFERPYRLKTRDVDMYRRLRLSSLFTWIQEAAINHTAELGAGREKTLDRGLLWVVAMEELHVDRLPRFDERVVLTTWPGELRRTFFPRYFKLETEEGERLLTASALWALIDKNTRHMVQPQEVGVVIPGMEIGEEPPLPQRFELLETTRETRFTVPFSYADLNGHMNNTKYLDLLEDVMPADLRERDLKSLTIEFDGEVHMGDDIRLCLGREGETMTLLGEGEKRLFCVRVQYA